MKKEAKLQTKFNQWLRTKQISCAFELKQCDLSLPFKNVVDHQRDALLKVRHGTLVYKIVDCGYQNPFDGISLTNMPAYVVIYYKKSRKFYLIDIDTFLLEEKRSKRKSLTWARAKEISTIEV